MNWELTKYLGSKVKWLGAKVLIKVISIQILLKLLWIKVQMVVIFLVGLLRVSCVLDAKWVLCMNGLKIFGSKVKWPFKKRSIVLNCTEMGLENSIWVRMQVDSSRNDCEEVTIRLGLGTIFWSLLFGEVTIE